MDWEVREIEKYYLTKKDPKFLYKNVEHMTPQELRDIVYQILNIIIYNILLFSLKKILFQRKKQRRN